MTEYPLDSVAFDVFAPKLREIARNAAREAIAEVNLSEVLYEVLPGLFSEAKSEILEAGEYMKTNGAEYINICHPSERHWEEEMTADAMEMRF